MTNFRNVIRTSVVVFFAFCVLLPDLMAHANTNFRTNCTVFRKRYKASTDVIMFPYLPLCIKTRKSCGGIWPSGAAVCSENCGYSEAYIYPNVNNPQSVSDCTVHELTANFNTGIPCWASMVKPSDLFTDIYTNTNPPMPETKDRALSRSEWKYRQILDYENRKFEMRDVNGEITLHKKYFGNTKLEVTLWKAQDDYEQQVEDTIITASKIIKQEFIRVKQGKIEISDGFKQKVGREIFIDETKDYFVITIKNMNYKTDIPENIDIKEELVITSGSYSEPEDDRLVDSQISKSDKTSSVKITPNPNNGVFEVRLYNEFDPTNVELKIFNQQGSLLKTYRADAVRENGIFVVKAIDLPSGIYYVSLQDSKGNYSVHKVMLTK